MTSRHNEMDFDMPEVEMPEDSEEMDLWLYKILFQNILYLLF